MEQKLKDILLSTFEPLQDKDDRFDERFYEFFNEEELEEILKAEKIN